MDSEGIITRSKSRLMEKKAESEKNATGVSEERVLSDKNAAGSTSGKSKPMVPSPQAESTQSTVKSVSGKSHQTSFQSKSTDRRKRLEAQIQADEKLARILEEEENLIKRRLEREKVMIKNRLALDLLTVDEQFSDKEYFSEKSSKTTDSRVVTEDLSPKNKVSSWLEQQNHVTARESHFNNRDNRYIPSKGIEPTRDFQDDLKTILTRQTIDKDLPVFSGNVKEWSNFYSQFLSSTTILKLTDEENIYRLRKCLKGEAHRAVEGLLISCTSLSKILEILRNRFGRPELIVRCLVDEAKNLPYIKNNDFTTLITFSDCIQNLVATLESLGMENYLNCPQLLHELIQKLPYSMQLNWGKRIASKKADSSLQYFQEWLRSEAEGASYVQTMQSSKMYPSSQGQKGKYNLTLVNYEERESKKKYNCSFCKENHSIEKCENFIKLAPEQKWTYVKNKKMCFSCIHPSHQINVCRKKKKCGENGCEKYHHKLLHNDNFQKNETNIDVNTKEDQVIAHMSKQNSKEVFLRVVPITVKNGDKEVGTFALLDEASTVTLIDQDFAGEMGFVGKHVHLGLKWTDKDTRQDVNSMLLSFDIINDTGEKYRLNRVYTYKNIDLPIQSVNANKFRRKWKHLEHIKFQSYDKAIPKLLIGQDHWELITTRELIEGPPNSPALSRTKLGWVLHGNVYQYKSRVDDTVLYINQQNMEVSDELHNMVKHFFTTEALGVKIPKEPLMSSEDKRAMDLMESVTKRIGDRWETGLLWKDDNAEFPDSKPTALQRLKCIERRMLNFSEFADSYINKIQEYIDKGYARKVQEEEVISETERVWYLPHFAVVNENKPGKIRLVFDCASKVNLKSLNDFLLKGPDLFNSILGILMKFRQKRIAFSADIREMFHQVRIRKEDQTAQRFLFREDQGQKEPTVYAMEAMIFGAVCSPFCAQYIKNRNALEFKKEYPEAVKAIISQHYMDDYLDSADTETESIRKIQEVIKIHKKGGFEIRGWMSNSKNVLSEIPQELRNIDNNWTTEQVLPSERVLGIKWDPNLDVLYYPLSFHKVDKSILNLQKIPTKRDVLKIIMSIYDPLGLLGYYVVRGKIILQEIWRTGIGWDDEIKGNIQDKWRNWLAYLQKIELLKIPRCYNCLTFAKLQLHIFSDASSQAFGCVAYFRFECNEQITVTLVMSKTQVAPLRPMSIPRLELQGALMACRLAENIKKEHSMNIGKIFFWTDSKTVLTWIRSPAVNFKMFVAHRVGEIQERSDSRNWRWISTKENVADKLTRDEKSIIIDINDQWFKGPRFLYLPIEDWPKEPKNEHVDTGNLENKENYTLLIVKEKMTFLPNLKKFSNWKALIRSTAMVFKFIKLCKRKEDKEITLEDLKEAENYWYRKIQEDSFENEIKTLDKGADIEKKSRLYTLTPALKNNLIILPGRTDKCPHLKEETKHPIILDGKHYATRLLILYYHKKTGHGGNEITLNELRQKFWIIQARKAIKTAIKCCMLCSIRRSKPKVPQMGQLPDFRLTIPATHRAFTYVGIDYFGGYEVTIGRRREIRYGVIFTCLSVRAVHVEVAESLNTDSAILAIRRFIARRGQPKMIISDNGTNFHSANKDLKNSLKNLDQETIQNQLCAEEIEWKFICPGNPHSGGAWERMVRSVKTALKITLKEYAPRPEVLQTLLAEAEHLVNSRPLTYVSSDNKDPESLTPNHFLIGTSSIAKPPGLFQEKKWELRKQWRISQSLAEHFWNRWVKEYIPTLTKRTKWYQQNKNLKENDLVIIMDSKLPRNNWPMGKVTKTYPGSDNMVRVVDVQTKTGIYRRPTSKICTLDCLEMGEDLE